MFDLLVGLMAGLCFGVWAGHFSGRRSFWKISKLCNQFRDLAYAWKERAESAEAALADLGRLRPLTNSEFDKLTEQARQSIENMREMVASGEVDMRQQLIEEAARKRRIGGE